MINLSQPTQSWAKRRGFTMIELLVVISIILIIVSLTAATFNFVRESDRVSAEAGKFQSFVAGARDRAIYANEPRGVRLFVEPAPPGSPAGASPFSRTVSSVAMIAPGGTWSSPRDSSGIDLMRIDGNILDDPSKPAGLPGVDADGDFEDPQDLVIKVRGSNNPGWWNLKRRGWLVDGLRIRIPAGPTGHWYNVNTRLIDTSVAPTDNQFLLLDIPYSDGGNLGQQIAWRDLTYELELPPRILPQEPMLMADGVVIDLDGSHIPTIWRPASTGNLQYSGYMDIWFSPRGNVIGEAASQGLLHFYVCDSEDAIGLKQQFVESLNPDPLVAINLFDGFVGSGSRFIPMDEIDPSSVSWLTSDGKYVVKDRRLVTIFGQTGTITVNKVNAYVGVGGTVDLDGDGVSDGSADSDGNGIADDPYRFAETGEAAE